MLLPFNALPSSLEEETSKPKKPTHVVQEETYADSSTDSSGNEDEEQTEEQPAIPRYIIPQKRSPPCKHHQENKLLLGDHQLPHLVGQ